MVQSSLNSENSNPTSQPENNDSILDDFRKSFRFSPLRLDRYGIAHWYWIVIVFYVVSLILFIILVFHNSSKPLEYFQAIDLDSNGLNMFMLAFVLGSLIFNSWLQSLPSTLIELYDDGRISCKDTENAEADRHISCQDADTGEEYRSFLEKYKKVLHSAYRYPFIASVMVFILVPVCVFIYLNTQDLNNLYIKSDPFLLKVLLIRRVFVDLLFSVIWSYFLGLGIWTIYITASYINNLTSSFRLHIQPSHPDNCGGLKPLGTFCLGMVLPIVTSAACLGAYSIGQTIYNQSNYVHGSDIFITTSNVCLLLVVLPLAILTFFIPLWDIHREMLHEKKVYSDKYAEIVGCLEKTILFSPDLEAAKAAKEKWDVINALHTNSSYPEWPFDRGILLRFWVPLLASVSSILIGFIIQVLEKKLL